MQNNWRGYMLRQKNIIKTKIHNQGLTRYQMDINQSAYLKSMIISLRVLSYQDIV